MCAIERLCLQERLEVEACSSHTDAWRLFLATVSRKLTAQNTRLDLSEIALFTNRVAPQPRLATAYLLW